MNPFRWLAENRERNLAAYKPNPGRELAKMRNPDERRKHRDFHNQMREKLGLPKFQWSDEA